MAVIGKMRFRHTMIVPLQKTKQKDAGYVFGKIPIIKTL